MPLYIFVYSVLPSVFPVLIPALINSYYTKKYKTLSLTIVSHQRLQTVMILARYLLYFNAEKYA